jgi:hypothetical protein
LNNGLVELPYLSTEAADYVKAVVERQRIGKYPQIAQITQILFQILYAPSSGPNKALALRLVGEMGFHDRHWPLNIREAHI